MLNELGLDVHSDRDDPNCSLKLPAVTALLSEMMTIQDSYTDRGWGLATLLRSTEFNQDEKRLVERLFSDLTTVFMSNRDRGIKHMVKDHAEIMLVPEVNSNNIQSTCARKEKTRLEVNAAHWSFPLLKKVKARCDD